MSTFMCVFSEIKQPIRSYGATVARQIPVLAVERSNRSSFILGFLYSVGFCSIGKEGFVYANDRRSAPEMASHFNWIGSILC
jgi:hypothetical protein